MCGFCDVENKLKEPLNLFTDEDYENLIMQLFLGSVSVRSLDVYTYRKIARKLLEGVYQGYGKYLADSLYGSADYKMLFDLRENIYVFSGAKTYQQVREVTSLLTTDGAITSFKDFRKQARDILHEYNEVYLKTEYETAIMSARSASMWQEIEKDIEAYPFLTYQTVGDGRVRPEHAMLDRITRPVNDKFWNNFMPPNGWNCRCTVIQEHGVEVTSLKGFQQPKTVPDIFMMNPGKDRIIFSPKHPYFDVAPKDREFAKRNFELPIP